ncbi:hypothetical protein QYE76_005555 [Lolium multiflorum]|uniref:Protein kinase domain-containing protein n=1 Tax=Lolium multiflorum TaxID=4521 RepID=A0AAD8RU17_LOLMU|nr:hypothetical protein QYE76_005555 [Lolium multiflorum]
MRNNGPVARRIRPALGVVPQLVHTVLTVRGTPLYVAPKVFLRKGYDSAKADAWSFDIILFVLTTGCKPFRGDDLRTLYHTICRGDFR